MTSCVKKYSYLGCEMLQPCSGVVGWLFVGTGDLIVYCCYLHMLFCWRSREMTCLHSHPSLSCLVGDSHTKHTCRFPASHKFPDHPLRRGYLQLCLILDHATSPKKKRKEDVASPCLTPSPIVVKVWEGEPSLLSYIESWVRVRVFPTQRAQRCVTGSGTLLRE
jgi:hypothetical protein